jgi:Mg-chelatase subunit ChlD
MKTPLTSRNRQLLPTASEHYREELFVSLQDSIMCSINDGDCALLSLKNIVPEADAREEPVSIRVEKYDALPDKTLKVNSLFLDELQLSPGQEWELLKISDSQPIDRLALEPVFGSFAKSELVQMSRSVFNGRCMLTEPGNQEILLKMGRGRSFKVRESRPAPADLPGQTVLRIEPNTYMNLYLPGMKPGKDLVLILDVSKSMRLRDHAEKNERVVTRLEAASQVVKLLFDWYFETDLPKSRFGMVAFGNNARVAYPEASGGLAKINQTQAKMLCREIPNLLGRMDVTGSNLIEALKSAASLFDNTVDENNDKMLILISDGAYWGGQDIDEINYVNPQNPAESTNVAAFIQRFYQQRKTCIHSVAIGTEEGTRRFEPGRFHDDLTRPEDKRTYIPNPKVLSQISHYSNGRFTTIEDIDPLHDLLKVSSGTTIEFACD